jgi:hypothetical protein
MRLRTVDQEAIQRRFAVFPIVKTRVIFITFHLQVKVRRNDRRQPGASSSGWYQ